MRTILRFPGIGLIFVGASSRLHARAALILPLLLLAMPAAVQGQFRYATNNDSIIILGYDDPGGVVTIPSTINSHPVTGIDNFAFAGNTSLTSVTIGGALTFIDFAAFAGCTALTNFEVNILNPAYSALDGVRFSKMQGTLVAFPAGKAGGYSAPNGTTNIGAGAFFDCIFLTDITLPQSVTEIGGRAFEGCAGLQSVQLEDGLASIGGRAFAGCTGLTSVTIPASLTNIVENFHKFDYRVGSFQGCSGLTNITVDSLNATYSSLDGILFNKSLDRLIICPAQKVGDYIVPSSVTSIAPGALLDCTELNSVIISDSVTSIENGAFQGCSGLTSITLGAGVTNLGGFSFDQYSAPQLTNITVNALNPAFSSLDGALFSKRKDTLIAYPPAKRGDYSIPSGVTSIGATYDASPYGSAFTEHSGLTGVIIPDTVTSIADYAFGDCTNLTSATIGNGVTSIGRQAFDVCTALTSVTIGSAVASIGHWAFSDCPKLRTVFFLGDAPAVDTFAFEAATNAIVYYRPGTRGWRSTFAGRPTALWYLPNPVILNNSSSLGVQSNGFGFTISWATNIAVVVEASTNLSNPAWVPLRTNLLTGGSSYFNDPKWTNYPARYYRVIGL